MSKQTANAPATSPRETLNRYIDGATQALAKKISEFEREAKRQAELQEAKFAARMSELGWRLESVAGLERRLAESLATLQNGHSIEDVRPIVADHVEQILAGWDRPKDGVSVEQVRQIIAEQISEAIARLREDRAHEFRDYGWTPPQTTRWPQKPIIDAEVEDSTPNNARPPLHLVTAAVAQLPRRTA